MSGTAMPIRMPSGPAGVGYLCDRLQRCDVKTFQIRAKADLKFKVERPVVVMPKAEIYRFTGPHSLPKCQLEVPRGVGLCSGACCTIRCRDHGICNGKFFSNRS